MARFRKLIADVPDGRMPVIEHLREFRHRAFVSSIAFVLCMILAYVFYQPILDVLTEPLGAAGKIGGVTVQNLYVPGITTAFVLRMKISAVVGLLLALPVILYQFWRFITPGLSKKEKRYAIPFVASSTGLFALGAWFAFLVLPAGIRFLLAFIPEGFEPLIQFHEYIGFVMFMMLAFGITFEFPLLLVFLAIAGIITSEMLRGWRRYAVLSVFLVSAVATPSQDPLTQTAMAVPLYILYEASILVVRFGLKR